MAAKNDMHTPKGEKNLLSWIALGGEDWGFGEEDSPLHPPVETLVHVHSFEEYGLIHVHAISMPQGAPYNKDLVQEWQR